MCSIFLMISGCAGTSMCKNIERLPGANSNFKIMIDNVSYVLRIGKNRDALSIDREREIHYYRIGQQLGISPCIIAWHTDEQIIVAEYIENYNTYEKIHTPEMIKNIIEVLKKLHAYSVDTNEYSLSTIFARNDRIIASAERLGILSEHDCTLIQSWMAIRKSFEAGYYDGIATGICHGDLYYKNILEDASGKLYLIDWEYAFYGYTIDDLGKLCAGNDYTDEDIMFLVKEYYQHDDATYFFKIKQNIFMRQFSMYIWCLIQASSSSDKRSYYADLAQKTAQQLEMLQQYSQLYLRIEEYQS